MSGYDLDALARDAELAAEGAMEGFTFSGQQFNEAVVALVRVVKAAQAVEKWSARVAGYSPGTVGANRSFSDACDKLRQALKPFGTGA